MTRRALDLTVAAAALATLSPAVAAALALVWLQDRRSPFYVATRIGKEGRPFRMVKIRSMVVRADRGGPCSTAAGDRRVTPVGGLIRRLKLDEATQLWNVLRGEMALVGPRPAAPLDVALYTEAERRLLEVRPGVTDPASIVFADEADILRGSRDADLDYMRLIRPFKSRISLFYARQASPLRDLRVLWLTARAAVDRRGALAGVADLLAAMGAPADLVAAARRDGPLVPLPPPGAERPIGADELARARAAVLPGAAAA